MQRLARLAACSLTLLVFLVAAGCAPPRVERVVLVSIDTLRADYVGAYGGRWATAHLDAIAAQGVRFETAISPTPITLPSHTSMLTGQRPPRHGVRNNGTFRLSDDVATLAERMQDAGFATAAFLGASVLDRQYGLARGFDHYDDEMAPRLTGTRSGVPERTADRVVDAALAWLDAAPSRFFLWVHLYDPHANYRAPSPFRERYPESPYFAEIAFADHQLGRLLRGIEAHGEGSLVVVTSDHGEGLGEHGESTHSLGLYDTTQRVPLLMRGPGLPEGEPAAAVARLVDVAPTILALAQLPSLPDADGRDLFDASVAPELAYLETLSTQLDMGWSPLLGLRSPEWKYIRAPRPELYALDVDPAETRNLYASQPAVAARLDRELDALLSDGRAVRQNLTPDADSRALLESLGYVVAAPSGGARFGLGRVGGVDPKDGIATLAAIQRAWERAFHEGSPAALDDLPPLEGAGFYQFQLAAEAALDAGVPQRAEAFARAAVQAAPEFWEGYVSLGRALEAQGSLDAAERAYGQAAGLDAAAADPLVGLGRIAEARSAAERAARLYESATSRRGNSIEAHWRLAALRIEAGDDAGSARLLAPLPEESLQQPAAALRLAAAEARSGRGEDARSRLDAALERRPRHRALQVARAQLAEDA